VDVKTPKENYEMLRTVYEEEALSVTVYLSDLNGLKTDMRMFRMIKKVGVLQPREMRTRSQLPVKW
jgi:hypothetical protein